MLRRVKLFTALVSEFPRLRALRRPKHSWHDILQGATAYAHGFLNPLQAPSEVTAFLAEVEHLRPRVVLEIGTATGGMLFLLSRAAARDAHLLSLDLPGGLGGGGYASWKQPVFAAMMHRRQRTTFIRQDSHSPASLDAVTRALNGSSIDLLFIDGDHTYEGVRRDFEMYGPLVRPGGLIAFHDIQPNSWPLICAVDRFWREIRDQYDAHEYVAPDEMLGKMGIGVLRSTGEAAPLR